MSEVTNRVLGAREYLGLSTAYVAGQSGLDLALVESIEAGRHQPTDLELRRLGRVLGYPVAYFRGETEAPDPESLQAVARWAEELDEDDRAEAMRFAEYLRFAALSEADAAS